MITRENIGHGALIHQLKCDPDAFIKITTGFKLVELRENDRGFEAEDYILLRQTRWNATAMKEDPNDKKLEYTGRHILLKIIHVQSGYGLKDGYVALSIRKLD